MQFTKIFIIYNPNSTGDSEAMAKKLRSQLRKRLPDTDCDCIPTKYARHAIELARTIAKEEKAPLIVSSSGDGGYNEVINGVMTAGNDKAICAVLPAGNANDHSNAMHDQPLASAIVRGTITKLDLIKISIRRGAGTSDVHYAHSYIGLGLTPVVATELNKHSLNKLREAWVVIKSFWKYRPFKIRHNDRLLKLDSLLFGNINRMAKVLTLAPQNRPADGKFEIISFPGGNKWNLVKHLAQAAASHLEDVQTAKKYTFTVLKKMPLQIDGEVLTLAAGSNVTVESKQQILRTIV